MFAVQVGHRGRRSASTAKRREREGEGVSSGWFARFYVSRGVGEDVFVADDESVATSETGDYTGWRRVSSAGARIRRRGEKSHRGRLGTFYGEGDADAWRPVLATE